jgi:hypothetical protein
MKASEVSKEYDKGSAGTHLTAHDTILFTIIDIRTNDIAFRNLPQADYRGVACSYLP